MCTRHPCNGAINGDLRGGFQGVCIMLRMKMPLAGGNAGVSIAFPDDG